VRRLEWKGAGGEHGHDGRNPQSTFTSGNNLHDDTMQHDYLLIALSAWHEESHRRLNAPRIG
jgi:hypothetical protein